MKTLITVVGFVACTSIAAVGVRAEDHPSNPGVPNQAIPLFTQCPPVNLDTGCGTLITINANGTVTTADDPNQGPYDGSEDQLVAIQNNLSAPICSVTISSSADLFGFDGDGLCNPGAPPVPANCPFGPTGYEGPGVSFDVTDLQHGKVNFNPCIAPGHSAFFSLEEPGLADVTFPTISTGTQPAPAMNPMTLAGLGFALAAAGVLRVSRRRAVRPQG